MKHTLLLCVAVTLSLSASEQTNKEQQAAHEQSTVSPDRVKQLMRALKNCDYDEAEELLFKGQSALANAKDETYQETMLSIAIQYCPSQFVKLLIDKRAEVNARTGQDMSTHLSTAALFCNPATFMILLEKSAPSNDNYHVEEGMVANAFRFSFGIYRDMANEHFGPFKAQEWARFRIWQMIDAKRKDPDLTSFDSCFTPDEAQFLEQLGDPTVKNRFDAENLQLRLEKFKVLMNVHQRFRKYAQPKYQNENTQ